MVGRTKIGWTPGEHHTRPHRRCAAQAQGIDSDVAIEIGANKTKEYETGEQDQREQQFERIVCGATTKLQQSAIQKHESHDKQQTSDEQGKPRVDLLNGQEGNGARHRKRHGPRPEPEPRIGFACLPNDNEDQDRSKSQQYGDNQ